MRQTLALAAILSLLSVLKAASGAHILMITLGGTKSHKIPFLALAKGLIPRGHRVTLVSGFVPDVDNGNDGTNSVNGYVGLRELAPNGLVNYIGNYTNWDLLGARYAGKAAIPLLQALRYPAEACNSLLLDNETRKLLTHRTNRKRGGRIAAPQYELAILDGAFPECALGIVRHLSGGAGAGAAAMIPFIYINTVGFYTGSLAVAGNPIVYAVTPHVFSALTQTMNYWQRVRNCATHLLAAMLHQYCTWQVHAVLQAQLGEHMPHPYSMARNVSFILQNGLASVSYPRPLQPNVAEIACLHCRPARPLTGELANFVAKAPLGVILFSMGSSVRASNMPPQLLELFVAVFARLPQYHVLWKWEGNDSQMPTVSANVRLSAWLPQQDVLGHRRLRLFITHGGLLSMYEAIYHAAPMVMLPVFCDHDVNAAKAAEDGYALRLSLASLTSEELHRGIQEVLHCRQYQRAVRRQQNLLLDQPVPPLERAIYWVEYVLRHKGAAHLQDAARELSFLAYHSLDVLLPFLVLLPLLILLLIRTISRLRAQSAAGGTRKHEAVD